MTRNLTDSGGLLLVGVGGQGVVRTSSVAAAALIAGGYDVKQSEVHGMAQRGGVVFSHLRFGPSVASPLLAPGGADAVIAFEWAEALRWLGYLRPDGTLVASTQRIVPPASCSDRRRWLTTYPATDARAVAGHVGDLRLVDAGQVASAVGNAKAAGSVLLGIVSTLLELPEHVWEDAIAARVPARTVDANLKAFRAGRIADFPQTHPVPAHTKPVSRTRPAPRPVPAVEITTAWCKGCDLCVRFCPQRCLAMHEIDGELRAVVANPGDCTGCRLCELLCPDFAIEVDRA